MALSEQELIRRESLKKIIEKGINPYPAPQFHVSDYSADLVSNFEDGIKLAMSGNCGKVVLDFD